MPTSQQVQDSIHQILATAPQGATARVKYVSEAMSHLPLPLGMGVALALNYILAYRIDELESRIAQLETTTGTPGA